MNKQVKNSKSTVKKNVKHKNSPFERIYYFDNLKFILIMLVVIGHFIDVVTYKSNYAKIIYFYIYTFHMPLFIFISGFFAKNSVENNNKNKIICFLILYILLSFLYSLIDYLDTNIMEFNLFETYHLQWYLLAMAIWYGISMLTKKMKKKYLLIFNIFLALIIGYDKNIGDFLALSRVIVFYPFFLLGLMCNKEQIFKIVDNKKIKYISIILLIISSIICITFIDDIYFFRPILTARNPYYTLKEFKNYGLIFRLLGYIVNILMGISIMSLIPKKETIYSKLGSRTISVYFFHSLLFKLILLQNINLRVYQLIIIGVIITLTLSLKIFSRPFDILFKIDFFDEEKHDL